MYATVASTVARASVSRSFHASSVRSSPSTTPRRALARSARHRSHSPRTIFRERAALPRERLVLALVFPLVLQLRRSSSRSRRRKARVRRRLRRSRAFGDVRGVRFRDVHGRRRALGHDDRERAHDSTRFDAIARGRRRGVRDAVRGRTRDSTHTATTPARARANASERERSRRPGARSSSSESDDAARRANERARARRLRHGDDGRDGRRRDGATTRGADDASG